MKILIGILLLLDLAILFLINKQNKDFMATQAALAAQLNELGVSLGKIGTETSTLLQKVADLEAQIGTLGDVTPELQAAFDAVKTQAQAVDDLVPDAPVV